MSVKISAKDVAQLRKQTGSGMMDCKKALVEANGDFEIAVEVLRKRGQKLAAKREDRDATEGVVIAQTNADGTKGIVINLSCETDFVAKNADFVAFAQSIADLALENFPTTREELLELDYSGMKLKDKVIEQVGVIGEKVEVSKYETLEAAQVVPYIHAGYKMGVLLSLNKNNEDFTTPAKHVAMQVAAMSPLAVDKDGIDASVVEKEIEIGKETARAEGKPEQLLERIAMGKLNKFYSENTLLNQKFVRDESVTVKQFLSSLDKDLTITSFKRVTLG